MTLNDVKAIKNPVAQIIALGEYCAEGNRQMAKYAAPKAPTDNSEVIAWYKKHFEFTDAELAMTDGITEADVAKFNASNTQTPVDIEFTDKALKLYRGLGVTPEQVAAQIAKDGGLRNR